MPIDININAWKAVQLYSHKAFWKGVKTHAPSAKKQIQVFLNKSVLHRIHKICMNVCLHEDFQGTLLLVEIKDNISSSLHFQSFKDNTVRQYEVHSIDSGLES